MWPFTRKKRWGGKCRIVKMKIRDKITWHVQEPGFLGSDHWRWQYSFPTYEEAAAKCDEIAKDGLWLVAE